MLGLDVLCTGQKPTVHQDELLAPPAVIHVMESRDETSQWTAGHIHEERVMLKCQLNVSLRDFILISRQNKFHSQERSDTYTYFVQSSRCLTHEVGTYSSLSRNFILFSIFHYFEEILHLISRNESGSHLCFIHSVEGSALGLCRMTQYIYEVVLFLLLPN